MPDPGAAAYGELLFGAIVLLVVVVGGFHWIKTTVMEGRLYSPEGVRRMNAEIARLEPIWARQDAEAARKLRLDISKYEAEGAPPGYRLDVARIHLARLERPDPTRHDFERDNIRLGLSPAASRYGLDITPEKIAGARRRTGA